MSNEKIVSLNISERKGTVKHPVEKIEVCRDGGIVGDAHGDLEHRQISLLSQKSFNTIKKQLPSLQPGAFAENILIDTEVVLFELPIGSRIKIGEQVILEVTQIGKSCHGGCEIKKKTGDCVMPREGIFAKVIEEGEIRSGDSFTLL